MQTLEIKIRGIVQGVGFRPFIHRLVREHALNGSIRNTSSGVTLNLEGEEEQLAAFLRELPEKAPPLAVIEEIHTEETPFQGFSCFQIIDSERQAERNTLISPDIGICPDCLREMSDPKDRRYRFPFINCTNCGPRFTIIEDVPYDRAKTSMKAFPMCPDCDREYHDIENRRYHAQPDCCPVCGPSLQYYDAAGLPAAGDVAALARAALTEGKIVAVKGLGGFHLACRCDDASIAERLRKRKQRDEKPFAVMCRDTETARVICHVSREEERILNGARKPIVLLKKKRQGMEHLSENGRIGVMLPYTPLHHLLFGDGLDMLIMTSANLSDTPIVKDNEAAVEALRGIADGFLMHNRRIQTRCDDSLCWVLDGHEYFARRSRGYVPQPVTVPEQKRQILACGAEQKASFCLGKGEHAFLSQHIGDLKNLETLEHYERQIRHFERLFDIHPQALVCDLHPDYLSTRYAQERAEEEGLPLLQVQHHHAHMAACMADNGLDGRCLGLVWDGTGLGTDGTSWGGELLAGDYQGFERLGSIRPIVLPGGDRAVKEPYRVAFSLLREAGCRTEGIRDAEQLARQTDAGLNCPLSTGMGRLFDGVSAILGIRERCSYEGQAAILLEAAAGEDEGAYPVILEDDGGILRFDWREMIRAIVKEKETGTDTAVSAARFMNTLIEAAALQLEAAAKETGLKRVVLSGGTFQNQVLMHRLPARLEACGLTVYHHRRVSCNDEGLSLGQLRIAAARGEMPLS
ncbi:MAG: carbamoyltransferase HypF [Oscillospiraceae bacterium]|nr:carbamoyltransferase HypF [Oscillospiraceae bacterium]